MKHTHTHANVPLTHTVMYRFAAFDPFERSKFFGRSFDLGQFERFRRVFHTPVRGESRGLAAATIVGDLTSLSAFHTFVRCLILSCIIVLLHAVPSPGGAT